MIDKNTGATLCQRYLSLADITRKETIRHQLGYLRAHGYFDGIGELFNTLKHQSPGLHTKLNVFGSIIPVPTDPTSNLCNAKKTHHHHKEQRLQVKEISLVSQQLKKCHQKNGISPVECCSWQFCNQNNKNLVISIEDNEIFQHKAPQISNQYDRIYLRYNTQNPKRKSYSFDPFWGIFQRPRREIAENRKKKQKRKQAGGSRRIIEKEEHWHWRVTYLALEAREVAKRYMM